MFTKSEKFIGEYCAQIVKIGKLDPIENSDFLVKTLINGGYQVVVGKNDVKEGDIMVYCKLETSINKSFLSINNQFEIGERHLNSNYLEVQSLIDNNQNDDAKKLCGYFNKHGRVRIVKLRNCPSEGCLFPISSIEKWKPQIKNFDFETCFQPNSEGIIEPFNFDTIDGEEFIKVYVPFTQEVSSKSNRMKKHTTKTLKRFNRLIEGQFNFHYDTNQLNDNMWRITPETVVTLSNKIHGTSHIVGNILVKKPKQTSIFREFLNRRLTKELKNLNKIKTNSYTTKRNIKKRIIDIKEELNNQFTVTYGKITSSRKVIKNKYINPKSKHFYEPENGNIDIWNYYGDLLFPYLTEGMTVYSEIAGYVNDSTKMIQKGYDYGCEIGKSFIMPYRITYTSPDGIVNEWEVDAVYGWVLNLLKKHPELEGIVKPLQILYQGTLKDLYPTVEINSEWQTNILNELKNDKSTLGMELDESLCKTKVPREGIVLRIANDVRSEAFKLKTNAFKFRESKLIDSGEMDVEMNNNYNI